MLLFLAECFNQKTLVQPNHKLSASFTESLVNDITSLLFIFFLKIPVHKGIQGMIKHDQTTQEELKPFFSAMAYNLLKRAFKKVFFKYIYQQLLKFCSDFGGSF